VNTAGPVRRTLICALLVADTVLSGCGNLTVAPGDTHEVHCRELREKLADKNIAPDIAAVVKADIEKAGCKTLLPGP
jgi:hypothetical protein